MADSNRSGRLFLGCFIALVATAFGFVVRGAVLSDWGVQFDLSEEQKGVIGGVGLYPFAISIILLSLVVDRIGYGTTLGLAFVGHVVSILGMIFAPNFQVLYAASFLFSLSNGAVEAAINPVVATIYRENKTKWLNVLHAGWPLGMVLGGLLSILVVKMFKDGPGGLPGHLWQWQMGVLLLPVALYGVLLIGLRFPQQERVQAGVSYRAMLEEFGWGSAYIVSFLLIMGVSQVLLVFGLAEIELKWALALALIPTVLFAIFIQSFGRPMFVFLLLVMFLLATTELGTDQWIQDIMGSALDDPVKGTWFLVYTAAIMFVMRFFAGPIVHRLSPLGLLATCAAIAAGGLYWLGNAGTGLGVLFAAATFYGIGKSFFWPTTIGLVSEQYPRGGALLMNTIAGVGMIAVGTIGVPAIGTLQDHNLAAKMEKDMPAVHEQVVTTKEGVFMESEVLDSTKVAALPAADQKKIVLAQRDVKQHTLAKIGILPAIMCVCYLALIVYYQSRGGYRAEVLDGHADERD